MIPFYTLMGRVFYSLAIADGKLRPEEFQRLKQLIDSEWLQLDDQLDQFKSDAAYQIEIVFEMLSEDQSELGNILADLKEFKSKNPSLFSPERISLIIRTAAKVANSVGGANKSELSFLHQLEQALKN